MWRILWVKILIKMIMQIEYEVTFTNIDKDEMRKKLKKAGAKLVRPEFLMKRVAFNLPMGHEREKAWVRVRDEGDKVTMTFKQIAGDQIEDQKEINIVIDSFKSGVEFLKVLGCEEKSFQENKREIWELEGVEICIDTWPWVNPYVEVEGKSKAEVQRVCELLEFDFDKGLIGSTDNVISLQYGIDADLVNNHTPRIVFGEENPYLVHLE